jgi:hypothetical protein
MLFCDRLSEQEMLEGKAANRESMLEMLLNDFGKAFPDLTFELQLDFAIINAQAMRLQGKPTVIIYGGLGLHPRLGAQSLTFIILHEVGHHLAEGCRSARDRSLACECASDYWAVTVGTDTLFQKSGRRLRMRAALEELNQVMNPRQPSNAGTLKGLRLPVAGPEDGLHDVAPSLSGLSHQRLQDAAFLTSDRTTRRRQWGDSSIRRRTMKSAKRLT